MNWYYAIEGLSRGPVSESALAELAQQSTITTDTLIWHPSLEEWQPVWKLKPDILNHPNKAVMAQQARGTTDRISLPTQQIRPPVSSRPAEAARPVAPSAPAEPAPQPGSGGFFKKLFGRTRKDRS